MLKLKTTPSCSRFHSSVPGMSNVGGKRLFHLARAQCHNFIPLPEDLWKKEQKSIGTLMYTKGAHHLKDFSGLKINPEVEGSAGDRVNRQTMKVWWHKSKFDFWSGRSRRNTFSSPCILFPVPSICTFPFVCLCLCSSSPTPPHISPFKDTVEGVQGVEGRPVEGSRGCGGWGVGVKDTVRSADLQTDSSLCRNTCDTLCYILTKTTRTLTVASFLYFFIFF